GAARRRHRFFPKETPDALKAFWSSNRFLTSINSYLCDRQMSLGYILKFVLCLIIRPLNSRLLSFIPVISMRPQNSTNKSWA
ncbi:MAG: hypothetical protein ACYT04_49520, partial [Nostoc sp.]